MCVILNVARHLNEAFISSVWWDTTSYSFEEGCCEQYPSRYLPKRCLRKSRHVGLWNFENCVVVVIKYVWLNAVTTTSYTSGFHHDFPGIDKNSHFKIYGHTVLVPVEDLNCHLLCFMKVMRMRDKGNIKVQRWTFDFERREMLWSTAMRIKLRELYDDPNIRADFDELNGVAVWYNGTVGHVITLSSASQR